MALTPATYKQVPDHSFMDRFYKQTYLGNAYILHSAAVSLSDTTETPLLLISNPVVAAQAFPNQVGLFVNLRRFTSTVQGATQKVYVNPVVNTLSTATIPSNLRPASTFASKSVCHVASNFSITSNGTLYSVTGCAGNNMTLEDSHLLLILDPGMSMLVTATALVGSTTVNAEVCWYEL